METDVFVSWIDFCVKNGTFQNQQWDQWKNGGKHLCCKLEEKKTEQKDKIKPGFFF